MFLVRLDDALNEIVTDNVALVEMNYGDAFNFADDFDGLDQAGTPLDRQINLRDVAGDHRLGIESQAREEHFSSVRWWCFALRRV